MGDSGGQGKEGKEQLTIHVCEECWNAGDDPYKITNEHLVVMMLDLAKLKAYKMIHGEDEGWGKYIKNGGIVHGKRDWLEKRFGRMMSRESDESDEDDKG